MYVDSMIGEFLNSLNKKILDKTIIVIFSEHGEMFAKHGRFGRSGAIRGTLYDEVIHVPLIIKLPGIKGKRVKGLTQIIDIMPTLLDILDIPFSQKVQGKNLLPLINDRKTVNEYVYAGTIYNKGRPEPHPFYSVQSINESIRGYKWKLIREVSFSDSDENLLEQAGEETFELYNLKNDPDEYTNLVDKYPKITKDLKEKLNKWVKHSQEFTSIYPTSQKFPEDLLRDARKHGYW